MYIHMYAYILRYTHIHAYMYIYIKMYMLVCTYVHDPVVKFLCSKRDGIHSNEHMYMCGDMNTHMFRIFVRPLRAAKKEYIITLFVSKVYVRTHFEEHYTFLA